MDHIFFINKITDKNFTDFKPKPEINRPTNKKCTKCLI